MERSDSIKNGSAAAYHTPVPPLKGVEAAVPLREKGASPSEEAGVRYGMQQRDVISYPYTSLVSNFKNTLEKLSIIFSNIFNKKVEFEIIKAQFPFQDSNILAQILGYNANKYKFRRMLKILIPRAVIKNPSRDLYYMEEKEKETLNKKKNLQMLRNLPSSYLPPLFSTMPPAHPLGEQPTPSIVHPSTQRELREGGEGERVQQAHPLSIINGEGSDQKYPLLSQVLYGEASTFSLKGRGAALHLAHPPVPLKGEGCV